MTAEDQLRHIDIRAPQSGIVHQLATHTVDGVIGAGEQIMLIVPNDDLLVLEAKIAPQDIDSVHVGQDALVRLTAFDLRTTPELHAKVAQVAPDLSKDQQSNQSYYLVRISLTATEVRKVGTLKPGMPAEVHLKTAERPALFYFLKSLQDQINRTFKDK